MTETLQLILAGAGILVLVLAFAGGMWWLGYRSGHFAGASEVAAQFNAAFEDYDARRLKSNAEAIERYSKLDSSVLSPGFSFPPPDVGAAGPEEDPFRHPPGVFQPPGGGEAR